MVNGSCPASVLVVEDDDEIRESIGELLEREGYVTALAEDWRRGLELLPTLKRPCLVLVDLIMSAREDGWSIMNALSHEDRLATIPVVVVSGSWQRRGSEGDSSSALAGDVLKKKPIELSILLDIVRDHCCGGGVPGKSTGDVQGTVPTGR